MAKKTFLIVAIQKKIEVSQRLINFEMTDQGKTTIFQSQNRILPKDLVNLHLPLDSTLVLH